MDSILRGDFPMYTGRMSSKASLLSDTGHATWDVPGFKILHILAQCSVQDVAFPSQKLAELS